MRYQSESTAGWDSYAQPVGTLPVPLDCETAALLRSFLTPILEQAQTWPDLAETLAQKGYGIGFLEGHLVVTYAESGAAICTGASLGVPLSGLSARLGRPCVKVHRDGHSGDLA